MKRKRKLLRI